MEILNVISSQKNDRKPLSSQEFQEMLNLWFEEKGVLKELRLQLRIKLVNLLKDTIIGKDICKGDSQGISLFSQAVNLIVTEYLMHSKCYYSLSVFNLEASFTSLLPKTIISNEDLKDNNLCNLQFNKQNVLHILELIGLAKNTVYSDKLLNMYFDNGKSPSILWCLITLICQLSNVNAEISETVIMNYVRSLSIESCDETYFLEKLEELLSYIHLSNEHVKKISQSIQTFFGKKIEQDRNELVALVNKQNTEIIAKNKKITELCKSKTILQRHLLKTNRYYKKTKAHLTNLQQEENILKRNVSQQNMNIDFPSIKNYDLVECNVKPNIPPVLEQEKMIICQSTHCGNICKENVNRIEDLLSENDILKKENRKQKESLKKLFLIYKDVLGKFNNCQNKLNFLNSKIDKELNEEFLNNFLCGGNLNVTAPLQENTFDSDVSSSTSLTEEILHDARIKLQKLENETRDIEDKFKHIHLS